jgi:hypothetical protein
MPEPNGHSTLDICASLSEVRLPRRPRRGQKSLMRLMDFLLAEDVFAILERVPVNLLIASIEIRVSSFYAGFELHYFRSTASEAA